ncbi:MAG TPA: helix-turn-helix domain-containing protein [Burkholderiales bacterium]|nr:helix-turn-helix domain-containing protein [Burkholderiales bacterium]
MDYSVRTPEQLGQVLKGVRKEKRITQAGAGQRVGMLQSAVSLIEADPGKVSVAKLFRLLSALGLELVVREKSVAGGARRAGKRTEW